MSKFFQKTENMSDLSKEPITFLPMPEEDKLMIMENRFTEIILRGYANGHS